LTNGRRFLSLTTKKSYLKVNTISPEKIDQLVYQYSGLTEAKIKTVESN